ncbi:MAG: 4Fe-4S dicluster domain-containing protein, partial [Candidatus Thiodiazotropha taylori]|nr:4Fe-4S dicluster domain-containing protein [Candidatus Thiodiazotropha taylori]MCW4232128.1 4Fe-4S dicluster domain-containing protein [Candidatus Thiodiazotropha taylori]
VILHAASVSDEASAGADAKHRWGMLIDSNKCADGCSACVDACNTEHGLKGHGRPATDAVWIRPVKLKDKQTGRENRLVMMCQHCEHPPCVDVCPTNASFKRVDGIVLVDRHRCIGCRYCMMACPYKARSFIHEALTEQSVNAPRGKGCVESCTLCVHRVDDGVMQTACQEACSKEGHDAILFGDLNDPNSEISKTLKSTNSVQIRADLELNTGVRYLNL